jgi:hypothetical protein
MTGRSVIRVAVLAALAGCSTAPPAGIYVKPGASAEQVARDEVECATAAAASDRRSAGVLAVDREVVDECMRGRGYMRRAAR